MKFCLNLLIGLALSGIWACTSSQRKEQKQPTMANTSEVKKDTVAAPTIDTVQYNPATTDAATASLVEKRLKELYKEDLAKDLIPESSRQFIFYSYDLNGDGKNEIFTGLTGSYFCGSGGCTILLLDDQGKLINRFTVVDYPVYIGLEKTNGWYNLFMLNKGEYHIMKFDGKKYPQNPSLQPVSELIPNSDLVSVLNYMNEPYRWFTF